MIYLHLFLSFFKIGLFGFGGGYAILSLIQSEVMRYGWMDEEAFVNMVAISQMTPGPIGINAATYVGYTTTGTIYGSALATFAIVLPSLIVMYGLCRLYLRFQRNHNIYVDHALIAMRFVVIGVIAAAAAILMTPTTFPDVWSWIIFGGCALSAILLKAHPILLICLSGIAGFFLYS